MWNQLHSAMAMMKNALGWPWASDAKFPTLPKDGSTMQAFVLRIERRYTQMG